MMTTNEKHELTLRFNSTEELCNFAKKYKDNIIDLTDYSITTIYNDLGEKEEIKYSITTICDDLGEKEEIK